MNAHDLASRTAPAEAAASGLTLQGYFVCFSGIVWREVLRFLHQRERFFSALVRPLVWLFIFAAGFRQVLGVSIIPPYESYVLYEVFIAPGLIGMILLFNAMQSSLSMVYDRETGAMRTLLVSPFPRSFLLLSKIVGGVAVALLQAYTFLLIAFYWDVEPGGPTLIPSFSQAVPLPWGGEATLATPSLMMGHFTIFPALVLSGLMLGALALFMSSVIKQLENFAGVMNFVIFPMFFASSALYPIWRIRESSPLLAQIADINPFTHAVELVRFAMYGQIGPTVGGVLDLTHLYVVAGCTILFLGAAIYAYNPSKGLIGRRGGPGGGGA